MTNSKVVIVIRDNKSSEYLNIPGITVTVSGWNYLPKKYKEAIIKHLQKKVKEQ